MKRNHPQKIRVAHLIYSPSVGGSEMLAADICARLDRSIFEPLCVILFSGSGRMPEILAERGVPYVNLRRSRLTRLLGPILPAFILRRLKIDILHVHHVPLFLSIYQAAKSAGIKIIGLTEHAKFSISKYQILQEGCRAAAQKAAFFTTVSQNLKDYLVKEINVPDSKMIVIPNGVNTSRFSLQRQRSAIAELLPDGFEGKIILCVGRLTEAKDHGNLFEAIGRLKEMGRHDWHLVVVGDGELRESLENQVVSKGLSRNVTFAGTRKDVELLLAGADLFVLPSKREGLPVAVLEAMAAGIPVISTNVGGVAEIVEDGKSGVLLPPEDSQALARKIDMVLKDGALASTLGRNARNRVEKFFSIDKIIEEYSTIYLNLLERGC
jgi:glycosyltransferase involved in cell wall biosynthesis